MTKSLVALPSLIADIGGTNGRFAMVGTDGSISEPLIFPIDRYPTISEAVAERIVPAFPERPRSMVLALAANLKGESAKLTHGHWVITPRRLLADFDLEDVVLLNDFEALALALPSLTESGLRSLGDRRESARGPLLVLGAGTGLGVAAMLPTGDAWVPVATEGGHMDFGAAHSPDFGLWEHLPSTVGRITAETVIAGAGIENLYAALSEIEGRAAPSIDVGKIVEAAKSGADPLAIRAIDLFARHLGRFAGDMALLFLARGGVFIGGGVVGRLGDLFDQEAFREAFADKAPFSAMLSAIPTNLIVHPTPAFVGIAALIAEPARYLVELTGRHWTGT